MSNTIFFAERYATCGSTGNPNAASTFGNHLGRWEHWIHAGLLHLHPVRRWQR